MIIILKMYFWKPCGEHTGGEPDWEKGAIATFR